MSGCPTNRRRLGNLTRRKHHNVSRSLSWCHLQYHLNHKANLVYRRMAKKHYTGQMQFSIVTRYSNRILFYRHKFPPPPMCRRQILSSVWRSGHREQCAVKNKRILEAMPVPESCKVGSSNHPPSKSSQMSKKYFRCDVQNAEESYECGLQTMVHLLLAAVPLVLSWEDSGPPEPTGSKSDPL